MNTKVNFMMRALANQAPAEGAITVGKRKFLKPKPFCGARDAKALENFIFDIGQYFKATNTMAEEAKVTLVTMHLSENAKLWWRSRYVGIQEGRCTIDTWDSLKRELRSQFFPENVKILARRKLRELKHTGTIREYVKQFAGLMLDISDVIEKDKIFSFVEGLKLWARTYTSRRSKTPYQPLRQLNACFICLVTFKRQDVIKTLHLEETETVDRILPKLSVEIEVPVETASLPSQIQGTTGKGPIIRGHPTLISVATSVTDHIAQGNAQIKMPCMPFRPLRLQTQMTR